jgi:hypothetical protein
VYEVPEVPLYVRVVKPVLTVVLPALMVVYSPVVGLFCMSEDLTVRTKVAGALLLKYAVTVVSADRLTVLFLVVLPFSQWSNTMLVESCTDTVYVPAFPE